MSLNINVFKRELRAPFRSIVFLSRPITAPLHPIFESLRSVFRSAHMLWR